MMIVSRRSLNPSVIAVGQLKTSKPKHVRYSDWQVIDSVFLYLGAVVNQVNRTVTDINGALGTEVTSNLNQVDQHTTTIRSSIIVETGSITTSNGVEPIVLSEPRSNITTADNNQQQWQNRKHIMISYNIDTASVVYQKLYDRRKVNI